MNYIKLYTHKNNENAKKEESQASLPFVIYDDDDRKGQYKKTFARTGCRSCIDHCPGFHAGL